MRRGRLLAMLLVSCLLLSVTGCAMKSLGPVGATGKQAVVSGPVNSSERVSLENRSGNTFCILCKDETGAGVDLAPDIANELAPLGLREVNNPKDAVYVLDLIVDNYSTGKGDGPAAGSATGAALGTAAGAALANTGTLDPDAAALVGLGILSIGMAYDSANTPNFCALEVNMVLDELVPIKSYGKTGKKGKGPAKQEFDSVRHEAVLQNWAKYMAHQATETDAVDTIRRNLAKEIAKIFKN